MLTSSPSSITEQTSLFALNGTTSLVAVALYVLMVVALWRVFSKAGYAGWLAIIPIVNVVFLTKVAGFSGWLALLYLIPIVGFVFHIVVPLRVGRAFGSGAKCGSASSASHCCISRGWVPSKGRSDCGSILR